VKIAFFELGLRIYILKKKVLAFLKIKFEALVAACKKSNIPVTLDLKEKVRNKSHYHNKKPVSLPDVDKFLDNLTLSTLDKDWWAYARGFAKTENNIVPEDCKKADPLNVLQICTSCTLFSDETS